MRCLCRKAVRRRAFTIDMNRVKAGTSLSKRLIWTVVHSGLKTTKKDRLVDPYKRDFITLMIIARFNSFKASECWRKIFTHSPLI